MSSGSNVLDRLDAFGVEGIESQGPFGTTDRQWIELVKRAARSNCTILVTGETGAGKEHLASSSCWNTGHRSTAAPTGVAPARHSRPAASEMSRRSRFGMKSSNDLEGARAGAVPRLALASSSLDSAELSGRCDRRARSPADTSCTSAGTGCRCAVTGDSGSHQLLDSEHCSCISA